MTDHETQGANDNPNRIQEIIERLAEQERSESEAESAEQQSQTVNSPTFTAPSRAMIPASQGDRILVSLKRPKETEQSHNGIRVLATVAVILFASGVALKGPDIMDEVTKYSSKKSADNSNTFHKIPDEPFAAGDQDALDEPVPTQQPSIEPIPSQSIVPTPSQSPEASPAPVIPPQTEPIHVFNSNLSGYDVSQTNALVKRIKGDAQADILSVQDMKNKVQFDAVKRALGTFAVEPPVWGKTADQPIFYDSEKYTKVSSAYLHVPGEGDVRTSQTSDLVPYMILKRKQDGKQIAVVNVNMIDKETKKVARKSSEFDRDGTKKRKYVSSQIRMLAKTLQEQVGKDGIVVVNGDMSTIDEDTKIQDTPYGVLTNGNILDHVYNLDEDARNITKTADLNTRQIYVSTGATIDVSDAKPYGLYGYNHSSVGVGATISDMKKTNTGLAEE